MTTPEIVAVVSGIVGSLAAIVALLFTWAANRKSDRANEISRDANKLAERALHMQEDDGRVRLVVEPRMMMVVGDGEDERPRPVVKVINLSKFPVTITGIHWKLDGPNKAGYWKNPTIANPYRQLPARLESRAALTAIGVPDCFPSVEFLLSIRSCVVWTDCGEEAEGMTEQWKEHCAKVAAKAKAEGNAETPTRPKR
jgi:hypothetical protein